MKMRTIALIGGAVLTFGGMTVAACSSSNNSNNNNTGDDGGNNNGQDSGNNNNGQDSGNNNGQDSGNNNGQDAGGSDDAACKSPYLFPTDGGGGMFCPYGNGDAGKSGTELYCTSGQECCLSGGEDAGGSICEAFSGTGVAFNNGLGGCPSKYEAAWQCAAPQDCQAAGPVFPVGGASTDGGLVCCLQGGALENETKAPYCSTAQKTFFGGTFCEPRGACVGSIDAGGYTNPFWVVCEQDSDCPGTPTGSAQTCQAVFTTGTGIGVCVPAN